jgi:L-arabinose isomerase
MSELAKPRIGVLMTMLDLYRQAHPEMPGRFATHWEGVLREVYGDAADLHFTGVSFIEPEVASAVASCERARCDLLLVLPLSYAPSGAAVTALTETALPILVVSSARDATLPYDMGVDQILANHAVHGVQDLVNVLIRHQVRPIVMAGHPSQPTFRERLQAAPRLAQAALVFRRGAVGQIGSAFAGMLDFDPGPLFSSVFGLRVEHLDPDDLVDAAGAVGEQDIADWIDWLRGTFDVAEDITPEELTASTRMGLALEDLVGRHGLDAVTMNFLDVSAAGVETMPFLGASALMGDGVGYAGEGDIMTAALVAALARLAGQATFTEMFCPDYERNEVLLSHMGECNFELARPDRRVRLVAKEFAYGDCRRPVVPVFQLKPGPVTLACLTAWPGDAFRLVVAAGEVLDAPPHPNLASPYSRIRFGDNLPTFLERYSYAGGIHHLALAYGDLRQDLTALASITPGVWAEIIG